jgi:hypothetical protein
VTPAMEAGLTDHVRNLEEICALLPKPTVKASLEKNAHYEHCRSNLVLRDFALGQGIHEITQSKIAPIFSSEMIPQ